MFEFQIHLVCEYVNAEESKLKDNNNGDHEFAELRTCL